MGVKVTNQKQMVYNFEVEGFHNYFVSNDGVLVHNACEKPIGNKPNFVVTENGVAVPVPKNASGPVQVTNNSGNVTGFAYTGGNGGLNGQVSGVRIMDPTAPKGASPGYPNGYAKYQNNAQPKPQGVDPKTGKVLPNKENHFPL